MARRRAGRRSGRGAPVPGDAAARRIVLANMRQSLNRPYHARSAGTGGPCDFPIRPPGGPPPPPGTPRRRGRRGGNRRSSRPGGGRRGRARSRSNSSVRADHPAVGIHHGGDAGVGRPHQVALVLHRPELGHREVLVGGGGPAVPAVVRDVDEELRAARRELAHEVGEDRLVADEGGRPDGRPPGPARSPRPA